MRVIYITKSTNALSTVSETLVSTQEGCFIIILQWLSFGDELMHFFSLSTFL